jgi:uncharacterized membrane protein
MTKGRIEAFSDGVLAIIITIMVLELKVPHGTSPADLIPLIPVFLSYALSFVYVAIYWNNHHHLFQLVQHVNGRTLWFNSHLLFWLSLIPFATAWAGENHFAAWPIVLYGVILFMAALAYNLLSRNLIGAQGRGSALDRAIGWGWKQRASIVLYGLAVVAAFFVPAVAIGCYVLVALLWFVPESRIEKQAEVEQLRKE